MTRIAPVNPKDSDRYELRILTPYKVIELSSVVRRSAKMEAVRRVRADCADTLNSSQR